MNKPNFKLTADQKRVPNPTLPLPLSKYQSPPQEVDKTSSPPNKEDDFLNGKRPYCGGDESCEACQ